jgi:undecaprenyl-diphosphatase
MHSLLHRFDTKVTNTVLGLPMSWRPLFLFITSLGHPVTTMAIGLYIGLVGLQEADMRLLIAGGSVWVTLGIGSLLKLSFKRARPITEYAAGIRLDTLSFPSGHTTGSTIAYGLAANLAWQLLPTPWNYGVIGLCSLVIITIGVSRVYLGAHFPTDVVGGWLLGGLALLMVIMFIQPIVGG